MAVFAMVHGDALLRYLALQTALAAGRLTGATPPLDVPAACVHVQNFLNIPHDVVRALNADPITGTAALRHFTSKFLSSAFTDVKFADVELLVAGAGWPTSAPDFIARAATMGIATRVRSDVWLGLHARRGEGSVARKGRERKRSKQKAVAVPAAAGRAPSGGHRASSSPQPAGARSPRQSGLVTAPPPAAARRA